MTFGTPTPHPDDICHCGDRRRDHIYGTGLCKLNGLGHGVPGYRCTGFRFAYYASETSKS